MGNGWIGLTCECFLDGKLVRMDIHGLTHRGFFVKTTALLEVGQTLSVRLVGESISRPISSQVIIEPHVAREERGPEGDDVFWFRLLRFSQEYGLLISGDRLERHATKPAPKKDRFTNKREDQVWLANLLEQDEEGEKRSRPRAAEQEEPDWDEYEPLSERAGVPLWSDDPPAPEVTVIDDGELDDVVLVLTELGVTVDRPPPDRVSLLSNWIPPQYLLVVTAKQALALGLPLQSRNGEFVSIAVSDGDARMVCARVRSLGYQYVISRPTHPLAMSMLFRQAIFPNEEQRVVPREVLGCSVHWWCGWARKRPGVMLDVSPAGCQLLVREPTPPGTRIKIRVPGRASNGRDFTLDGQVVRSSRNGDESTLGILFDGLPEKVQQSLLQVLALPGPCRLTDESLPLASSSTPTNPRRDVCESPKPDRRKKIRAAIREEIVALEQDSYDVKLVLVSNNLNVDGMHVEAHPSLALGEKLELALYEERERAPLILSAVAARDDGRNGWWLHFVDVTRQNHERLVKLLDRFPQVTRLDPEGSESEHVVLSPVLSRETPSESDELA